MRIRQRKVPFPISSLSPIPLSDPHSTTSPVVQLQLHSNPHENLSQQSAPYFDPHPSDQPNQPIGGQDSSYAAGAPPEDKKVLLQDHGEEKGGERERSNDARKESFLGAEMQTMILDKSGSKNQGARWCEGETVFPLKKRRGSFERRSSTDQETVMEKDNKKMKTKIKTKMNKKRVQQNGSEEDQEDHKETKEGADSSSSSVKMRARGGALLEGSRCSRVNGRGWRCCQQTLVGYSLCEHHLGKGRLRSMNSVRSRSMTTTTAPKKDKSSQTLSIPPSLSLQEEETKQLSCLDHDKVVGGAHEEEDDDKKKALVVGKKKTKLGMVKARSISSLLGQSSNANIAVAENINE